MVVLENVCGTLSSHGGKDFESICKALRDGGYRFGSLVIDAVHFVPQSRPRLFIVAVRADIPIPDTLCEMWPARAFHPHSLRNAYVRLPTDLTDGWIWWRLPMPPVRNTGFSDLLEEDPRDVPWHTPVETQKLLDMMSDINLDKVRLAKLEGRRIVGTVYKRTRRDGTGRKVQRAEVRFRRHSRMPTHPGRRFKPTTCPRCRRLQGAVASHFKPRNRAPHGPSG